MSKENAAVVSSWVDDNKEKLKKLFPILDMVRVLIHIPKILLSQRLLEPRAILEAKCSILLRQNGGRLQVNHEPTAMSGGGRSSYSRIHVTNGFDYDLRKELDEFDAMYDAGDAIGALRGFNALMRKYGTQRLATTTEPIGRG